MYMLKQTKYFAYLLTMLMVAILITQSTGPAQAQGPNDEALVTPVIQHPVQDEVLYFVIPDRFYNADTSNDCGGYTTTCVISDTEENVLTHGYLPSDKGYYHGGDLKGLTQKLDYIKDMGVTAIWVGPIFKNKPVQVDSSNLFGHSSGYHGYWITDFMSVDPHLGTNEEYKALIAEAHNRDIKVFMDIITNHTADVIQMVDNSGYRNKTDYPYKDTAGNQFNDSDYAYYGQADYNFPTMDDNGFPYLITIPDGETKNPSWLDNPLLYHNRGDTSFSGENSLYGDFFGLDDLFTEKKEVVDGMIDIYKFWIEEFGIDGFRIDTTKHVNMEFWQKFGPEILAAAKAEGIDHFFAFGEVYDQAFGSHFLSEFSNRGQLQSTIDFSSQMVFEHFATSGNGSQATAIGRIYGDDYMKGLFEGDDYYTNDRVNAYAMPTFVGNHDMGRIGMFLRNALPNADDTELLNRSKLAHALMFFSRGQPVIYYGDEQGFTGAGNDKEARQDMFANTVTQYQDENNDLIGSNKSVNDDNFDTSHPLYQALTNYANLYSNHVALRRGAQILRQSSNAPGVMAFSRIERDEKVEYIVAFNNGTNSSRQNSEITIQTFQPANTQLDLAFDSTQTVDSVDNIYLPLVASNSSTTTVTRLAQVQTSQLVTNTVMVDENGQATLSVPPLGFVIYKASQPLSNTLGAPAISLSQPAADSQVLLQKQSMDGHTVYDRIEVVADLGDMSSKQYVEVTFAVSQDGGDYQVIGTDDNPPYRVMYDVTHHLKAETMPTLAFKAIVKDMVSGELKSAQVGGVTFKVEEPTPPPALNRVAIHYLRSDGDYGDHTTGDYNDYWGLHLWGEAIDSSEQTGWGNNPAEGLPKPFLIETDYGRAASIKLADASKNVNFIVHKGDTKDGTQDDRMFNPALDGPEIWLKQDDGAFYTSQAAAQGYVTIHYHRPDGQYDGWGLHLWQSWGALKEWGDGPILFDQTDDYGVYLKISQEDYNRLDFSEPLNFIVRDEAGTKDPDGDRSMDVSQQASIWLKSQDSTIYNSLASANNYAVIHYHRPAGDYGSVNEDDPLRGDYYGLHVWTGYNGEALAWGPGRLEPKGTDAFGVYFEVPLVEGADKLEYIIYAGTDETKDPGDNQAIEFAKYGHEVWQEQLPDNTEYNPDDQFVYPIIGEAVAGDLSQAKAHWISQDTIVWNIEHADGNTYQLHYMAEGGLDLSTGALGATLALTHNPDGLTNDQKANFPHLANYAAFNIGTADLTMVSEILKGQIAVSATKDNSILDATGLQIPGVLDDLYTYDGELGVVYDDTESPTIRVWAPTAKSVKLHLYDESVITTSTTITMNVGEKGTWSASGTVDWTGKYYLFEVEVYVPSTGQVEHNLVTDPYSFGLSMNSTRSLIVNLDSANLKPTGWDTMLKPDLAAPEDIVLYELHVRDFSIHDTTVAEANRGTFKAFTETNSDGMQHLLGLKTAGLTHIHLLPSFDIATIEEDKSQRQEPTMPDAGPDSEDQQAAVTATKDQDGFNWGYDPYHYTVPEGSYATDPNGIARIIEFREMVKTLNDNGLRVVMDVVYNHTNSSGQADQSVLDKVVPGYYHRLLEDGTVATSTCCQNTATEHNMMEKLMIDSLKVWASAYKVDGFRFDLMGHHSKTNLENIHSALQAIDDDIYIYGEGWNFGDDVQNNLRFEQATQLNMAGTGIGTFNDRLRDAVRGGGPFDNGSSRVYNQGFINGLAYDLNMTAMQTFTTGQIEREALLSADQIRVGLAGNLADYQFESYLGMVITGAKVDYNGAPAGYTADPQEHINYISAHDNETLFDISQYKHPITTSMVNRVRAHNVGLSLTALSQGVPFFHAGVELLRSKSMDRNSYNSGDWFNKLDFTYMDNNWGVGLPPAEENEGDWPTMKPFLSNPALKPASTDIMTTAMYLKEMLTIRHSSPLFRLQTADEVKARVNFHNTGPDQTPGLIVMSLSDMITGTADLDPTYEMIVVLFNANDTAQTFTEAALIDTSMRLHPVQMAGNDAVVKDATYDMATGTFNIPARTTAVFVDGAVTPSNR